MHRALVLLIIAGATDCSSQVRGNDLALEGIWKLSGAPSVDLEGKSSIQLGGFSGLCINVDALLAQNAKSPIKLISISDRGPNLEAYEVPGKSRPQRPFLVPGFVPEILFTTWSSAQGWRFEERLPMRWPDGQLASGMPNSTEDENPVDKDGRDLPLDDRGIDPEGIALAADGNLWIAEEYGPSILKVNPQGVILNRYIPKGASPARFGTPSLPAELGERKINRGFEGVAITGDTLYAFLQSPLKKRGLMIRVLRWDTSRSVSEGLLDYPLHDARADKIGDVSALADGRLLVLEQDGETSERAIRKVFVWDPRSGAKKLVIDLTAAGFRGFEKVEGLSLISAKQLAVVVDNDYGVRSKVESVIAIFNVSVPEI